MERGAIVCTRVSIWMPVAAGGVNSAFLLLDSEIVTKGCCTRISSL